MEECMSVRSDRPNVVMVVLDDLGFSDFGCYGSGIATPNVDRLAGEGVRYSSFHTTPLCSPTRACLLTGRNHHRVGVGFLTDASNDAPGYTARIPKSAGTLPRLLRDGGYSTFCVGKWHLAPHEERGPAGPFDRWPLGVGFEHFYGFVHGMVDEFRPELVRGNDFIEPPSSPEEGYHLTEDLATQAIRFLQDQQQADPDRPFFMHFAPGAVHVPHQVPAAWIERYRGCFDGGWDVERERRLAQQIELGLVPSETTLTPRPSWVSAWDQLSPDEQRILARQMEVYAGYVTHTDAQIGRLLDFLERAELLDNTIVMVLSDNGAAGHGGNHGSFDWFTDPDDVEAMLQHLDDFGGPNSMCSYATGWAWAGNTPLRLWKTYTWLGGVRVPLIVHWPAGIDERCRGEVRSQFGHAVDLMPTILDAANVEVPEFLDGVSQLPLDGKSLIGTLNDAAAPAPRDTQYFEMLGSRSIYHDGWKATTDHVWAEDTLAVGSRDFGTDRWSLFHLDNDFSEAHDLAADEPERLRQLTERWWYEAGRNQVLPLIDSWASRAGDGTINPDFRSRHRDRYLCFPGGGPIETPPLGAGFRFSADIDLDSREPTGVICAQHLLAAACYTPAIWACYIQNSRLIITFNLAGTPQRIVEHELSTLSRFDLTITHRVEGGENGDMTGTVAVDIDGELVHSAQLDHLPAAPWPVPGMLLIGRDLGIPACRDYQAPFAFTGQIHRATYEPIAAGAGA
jgi:arylsulfatase A-like enzyme